AATSAPARSTVPRSTPPETMLGTICSTAGGRVFAGPTSFKTGAMLSSLNTLPRYLEMPAPETTSATASDALSLARPDGAAIAYHRLAGATPGVVFLGGFRSDMTGTKALFLEDYCRQRGRAYLRFDYFGHGESSGNFAEGTIGRWREDAIAVIDSLTEGPQILVGSSMGGWVMLLAALARPQRVAALVGIAAAPEFTEELLPMRLTPEQRREIEETGRVVLSSGYDPAGYLYTRALIEGG